MRSPKWLVIITLMIVAGWLAAGTQAHTAPRVESADADPRAVVFTYTASLPRIAPGARDVSVWIPLAKTGREQQILRRTVHSPVAYTITADPEYGNEMLHLSLRSPLPQELLKVVIDYDVRLLGNAAAEERVSEFDELSRDLQAQGLVIIDDEVRARARQATQGRATVLERARGIYDAVIQQVRYDKRVPGWGRGDTRRVCLLGAGNCTDFHSLFISMARASQVPARFKIGVVIPQEASGTISGYHCWAEFYEEDRGWIPVDASEAWKHPELMDYYFGAHDDSRLLISVGRDIQLAPRQQGQPINIFFYPHVEVDGQAVGDVETEFRFRELQQEGVV
jgi:transglutaminase-like putative cysteine protease